MNKTFAWIAVAVLGLIMFVALPASATNSPKVVICHATASEANPFTSNNVNTSSVDEQNNKYLNGHGDHEDDIIPAFTYGNTVYPGQNLTEASLAILANGCKTVVPTVPPTTTPPTTEEPCKYYVYAQVVGRPVVLHDDECPPTTPPGTPGQQTATPTPTVTESPTATSTETPVATVINTPGDTTTPVANPDELPATGFPMTFLVIAALALIIGGAALSTLTSTRSH